jgi:hypothetical protein
MGALLVTDYLSTMYFMLAYFWKPMLGIIVITSGCCYAALNLYAWHRGVEDIEINHTRRMR